MNERIPMRRILSSWQASSRRPEFIFPFALVMICPIAAHADDWFQFLGPTRNGISGEKNLVESWPREGPPIVWQKEVGAGFSGAVVGGNRLILFHRVGDEEVVESLDAASGKAQWKSSYPSHYIDQFGFDPGPRSTPLVAGGRVFTLGAEGTLSCLDLDTGKKIWRRSLNEEYKVPPGFFGVATSPLLEQDLLLVNVGGKGAGIVAFAKETGKEIWRAAQDGASYSSPVVLDLAGSREAVFLTREGIVLLDPRTGLVTFTKHFRSRMDASVNAATPVVVDNLIFFSACYGTGAILVRAQKDKMEALWENDKSMSNHYSTCIADNGYLYGFDGRQEAGAQLRCIELTTGKVRWTKEGTGCGSMILADGKLIVLTEKGILMLLSANPDSYTELARAPVLSGTARSPIALANGKLYARDTKKLICLNLKK
jgi:outer membrane protein assembly factor BamB